MREDIQNQVEALIAPILDDFGYELVDLQYKKEGSSDKCAVQRAIPLPWPFESRDQMVLDVYNENKSGVNLAMAFFTNHGRGFYESTGKYIKKGANKDVTYDLRSTKFKCAATGWNYGSPLKNPEAVNSVVLMIYPRSSGIVTFDNIRFVKK